VTTRPIILIGDVGVGKSIFLRHLILVDAVEELRDAIVIYVNFGSGPALRTDIARYVEDQFERQLLQSYEIDILAGDYILDKRAGQAYN